MFCHKCGKEINDSAKFCSACGAKLNYNENKSPNTAKLIEEKDPVFRRECEYCLSKLEYKLKDLGYRPWYPKGFVYCPKCKRPLRHSENYEVK